MATADNEAFIKAIDATLLRSGFERWGKDGWIRDDENGGTCYDTAWALERAELPSLAEEFSHIFPNGRP